MYGGDPYEDDVERVLPAAHPANGSPTSGHAEHVDKPR
jgi:hypothetical protein